MQIRWGQEPSPFHSVPLCFRSCSCPLQGGVSYLRLDCIFHVVMVHSAKNVHIAVLQQLLSILKCEYLLKKCVQNNRCVTLLKLSDLDDVPIHNQRLPFSSRFWWNCLCCKSTFACQRRVLFWTSDLRSWCIPPMPLLLYFEENVHLWWSWVKTTIKWYN